MRLTVVSKDAMQLAELTRLLRERSNADDISPVAGTLERLVGMSDMAAPDILLLAQNDLQAPDLERLERFGNLFPSTAFILVSPLQTPEFLLQAMRAGVREVVPAPANAGTLFAAIRRIAEKRENRAHANAKIIAFVSCKGGSGATFLAANLGYALATAEDKRVALLDLNLQFGDASLFVSDQRPVATLTDVAKQIHRLDPSFLSASMVHVLPNFGVLAAPEDPVHASEIKPDHIDVLLKLARRHYDFIILDVGRTLDAVSVRALDQADIIFPVLQTTLPYIRDGARMLDVFRSLDYRKDKIKIIVNRHEKGGEITLRDLEKAYDTRIHMTVPNHYDAAANSVNEGVPILKLAKTSPISKVLLRFAHELAGNASATETPQSSWFDVLRGR
ncbi:MAG: AAA family ATPase [Pseudomonadota bacterium]